MCNAFGAATALRKTELRPLYARLKPYLPECILDPPVYGRLGGRRGRLLRREPLFRLLKELLLLGPKLKSHFGGFLRKLAVEFPCEPEFKIFEEVSHCGAVLKHEICSLQCILRRLFCRFFPVCKLYFERPTPFHPGDRLFPHAQFNSCQRLVLIESEKRL